MFSKDQASRKGFRCGEEAGRTANIACESAQIIMWLQQIHHTSVSNAVCVTRGVFSVSERKESA